VGAPEQAASAATTATFCCAACRPLAAHVLVAGHAVAPAACRDPGGGAGAERPRVGTGAGRRRAMDDARSGPARPGPGGTGVGSPGGLRRRHPDRVRQPPAAPPPPAPAAVLGGPGDATASTLRDTSPPRRRRRQGPDPSSRRRPRAEAPRRPSRASRRWSKGASRLVLCSGRDAPMARVRGFSLDVPSAAASDGASARGRHAGRANWSYAACRKWISREPA
jgi:hypothetical protein